MCWANSERQMFASSARKIHIQINIDGGLKNARKYTVQHGINKQAAHTQRNKPPKRKERKKAAR